MVDPMSILVTDIDLISKKRRPGELQVGDFLLYSVSGSMKGKEIRGGVMVKFIKVSGDHFTVKVAPKKVPSMREATLEFPYNGKDLADLGGIIAGWSVLHQGSYVGSESMATPFGEIVLEHYIKIDEVDTGTLKVDQFVEPDHNLPFGSMFSGQSGEVTFGLSRTNIDWITGRSK